MIRPKQKLTLLATSEDGTPEPSKNISIMNVLREIVKDHPDATEELVQTIHDYMADMVYRSMSKGELLVMFDTFTFIPGHLDLRPEDFPPDDKTLHVRVDLEQPDIPGVDPGCVVMPDPKGRPM